MIISSIIALIFVCVLVTGLQNAPHFFVHITEYPFSYYQSQQPLIDLWKTYCYVAITFLSLILIISISLMVIYNYVSKNSTELLKKKKIKMEIKKQKRIEKLQAEIDALSDEDKN